jgi:magnesium-protoporphyrin O-methyltransferase
MSRHCCDAAARHFDATVAEKDAARYRDQGLDKRARLLLDAARRSGVTGRTVLDVGSGMGALSFELLKAGASHATLAEASPAYLAVAKAEAERACVLDRLEVIPGDFVETVTSIPAADIVVLDRVICCYPAWSPLLSAAMSRSRGLLALTYPKARVHVRVALGLENLRRRLKGDAFRAFVHPPAAIEAALGANGWQRISRSGTLMWRVELYARSVDELSEHAAPVG